MDLNAHLDQMQQAFLEVYRAALQEQIATNAQITPEVFFQLSDGQFYAVDMIRRNGDSIVVVEVSKEATPPSPSFTGDYRGMGVAFDPASWDALTLIPQGCTLPPAGLKEWSERWMDVEEQHKLPEAAPFGGVVHTIRPSGTASSPVAYDIDFGSAPPKAFLSFLDLLAGAGCSRVGVTATPLAAISGGG